MNVEIFIVTYAGDAAWLAWCLKSIGKYASGFSGVTVLAPKGDVDALRPALNGSSVTLKTDDRALAPLGFLDHMVQKCSAETWCPNADLILHIDSDCVFTAPVTPAEYMENGKPILLMEPFNRLPQSPWKLATESAMKMTVTFETMRRHPAVHHRGVYADLRDHISKAQGIPFRDYILKLKSDFPWGFSEFVALGQIALSDKWRDRYRFINLATERRPKDKLQQFWSHWGVDGKITDKGPWIGMTPRQVMTGHFGL